MTSLQLHPLPVETHRSSSSQEIKVDIGSIPLPGVRVIPLQMISHEFDQKEQTQNVPQASSIPSHALPLMAPQQPQNLRIHVGEIAWQHVLIQQTRPLFYQANVVALYDVFLPKEHADPKTREYISFANYFDHEIQIRNSKPKSFSSVSLDFLKHMLLMMHILNAILYHLLDLNKSGRSRMGRYQYQHFAFKYHKVIYMDKFHARHRLHLNQLYLYTLTYLATLPACPGEHQHEHKIGCLSLEAAQICFQIYHAGLYAQSLSVQAPEAAHDPHQPSEFCLFTANLLSLFLYPRLMEWACLGHYYDSISSIRYDSPFMLHECNASYQAAYKQEFQAVDTLQNYWNNFRQLQFRFTVYNYERLTLLNNIKYLWNRGVQFLTNRDNPNALLVGTKTMRFTEETVKAYQAAWTRHIEKTTELVKDYPTLLPMKVKDVNDTSWFGWLFASKPSSSSVSSSSSECITLSFSPQEEEKEMRIQSSDSASDVAQRPVLYDLVPHHGSKYRVDRWMKQISKWNGELATQTHAETIGALSFEFLKPTDQDRDRDHSLPQWSELLKHSAIPADIIPLDEEHVVHDEVSKMRVIPLLKLIL